MIEFRRKMSFIAVGMWEDRNRKRCVVFGVAILGIRFRAETYTRLARAAEASDLELSADVGEKLWSNTESGFAGVGLGSLNFDAKCH